MYLFCIYNIIHFYKSIDYYLRGIPLVVVFLGGTDFGKNRGNTFCSGMGGMKFLPGMAGCRKISSVFGGAWTLLKRLGNGGTGNIPEKKIVLCSHIRFKVLGFNHPNQFVFTFSYSNCTMRLHHNFIFKWKAWPLLLPPYYNNTVSCKLKNRFGHFNLCQNLQSVSLS